jgi:hypothetical protein
VPGAAPRANKVGKALPGRTAAAPEQPERFSQNNGDSDAYGPIFNPEMDDIGRAGGARQPWPGCRQRRDGSSLIVKEGCEQVTWDN